MIPKSKETEENYIKYLIQKRESPYNDLVLCLSKIRYTTVCNPYKKYPNGLMNYNRFVMNRVDFLVFTETMDLP
jgi:hypothetical protein